jgi:hypothetical protein
MRCGDGHFIEKMPSRGSLTAVRRFVGNQSNPRTAPPTGDPRLLRKRGAPAKYGPLTGISFGPGLVSNQERSFENLPFTGNIMKTGKGAAGYFPTEKLENNRRSDLSFRRSVQSERAKLFQTLSQAHSQRNDCPLVKRLRAITPMRSFCFLKAEQKTCCAVNALRGGEAGAIIRKVYRCL